MTIEPFSGKAGLTASYRPDTFLSALHDLGWEPGSVPRTVIYTYARFESYLSTKPGDYPPNDMLGTGPGRFFLVNESDGRVGINCLGTGPSATAAQIELQASRGVTNVILIGTAGGLSTYQRPGEIVLPDSAVRADGTSDHYAPPDVPARPDDSLRTAFGRFLAERGIVGKSAPCWTTAAAFRTTPEELDYYARLGVVAVEEEAAALFIVGAARGIRSAAALVLDGVPRPDGGWHVDFGAAQQALRQLLTAAVTFAITQL